MPRLAARRKTGWHSLGALALACASHRAEPPRRISGTSPSPSSSTAQPGSSHVAPSRPTEPAPTLLITDRQVLGALEEQGLALGALLGSTSSARGNAELARLASFAPVVEVVQQDVRRAAAEDRLAGVQVARYSHRLFDQRFLRSSTARFELAGVVSRPDRAAFEPGSCGETRLIYRLAYDQGDERSSRLPMTIGVELQVPRGSSGCREAAARWVEPAAAEPGARAGWLRSSAGPLSKSLVSLASATTRVVLNLQLVRWPATVRPDLGGHAEYVLRSFRPDGTGVLRPEPLENTIDPDALHPAARQALTGWLREHRADVDAGTPLLPPELLTQRSLSVTPRGLSRLANRPFSAALSAKDFAAWDFAGENRIKSRLGLLRRLDQLSCAGCHQARSVAGFHLLGEDSPATPVENALALPVSPQVLEDLPRRLRIARQMLAGVEPDLTAPFAERASAAGAGGYGAHCSLNRDPTFAGWDCAAGLRCSAIEASSGDAIGQCLPEQRQVGDACEQGSVTAQRDRRRDRMSGVELETCPNMVCNRSGVGFPAGMCTAACGAPGAVCGPIAVLDSFNACLGRGETFLKCIRGNVNPAGLRGCDAEHACRDDYVCARAKSGGVCLPPYFVFQLRVDGHDGAR